METRTTTPPKQLPPRPTAASKIEQIVAIRDDELDHDDIFVTIGNDTGEMLSPQVQVDDLLTFDAFRSALRDRFGVEFDDRGQFTGHGGHDRWQTHVYELFGRELPQ